MHNIKSKFYLKIIDETNRCSQPRTVMWVTYTHYSSLQFQNKSYVSDVQEDKICTGFLPNVFFIFKSIFLKGFFSYTW